MILKHSKNKTNTSFMLFLCSHAISSIGDSFHFIAVAAQLIHITGSGLSAAFGLLCTPLSSIVLSCLAGSLGDSLKSKSWMVFLDLLRGGTVLLFVFAQTVWQIYLLSFLLAALDTLASPPRRKFIVNVVPESALLHANAMLNGLSGVTFLIGPTLAGMMTVWYGSQLSFWMNSGTFFASALLLLCMPYHEKVSLQITKGGTHFISTMREGFDYYQKRPSIRRIVFACTVICMVCTSINVIFYPYAFDILHITAKQWGIMMSVFYGTNLCAMGLAWLITSNHNQNRFKWVYACLAFVAVIWALYPLTHQYGMVILLQFFEGTFFALFAIIISTQLQVITDKHYIARVAGLNEFINNVGKLVAIGITYTLLAYFSITVIFWVNAVILLLFASVRFTCLMRR